MLYPTHKLKVWFQHKFKNIIRWLRLNHAYTPDALMIDKKEWTTIKQRLRHHLHFPPQHMTASIQEQVIIQRIQNKTRQANRNNITRTQAYWDIAQAHPELHWALLAHVVSRNGGWNMTDLQGEWLPELMSWEERLHFFRFLETTNAFIFQDAYPQLLLYTESRKANKPLFHLLPYFHVSRFMLPFWNSFWQTSHSPLLTVALIVNEQHYIEDRIVRHPYFREKVLDHLLFRIQSLFQLNQILIPHSLPSTSACTHASHLALCGAIIEKFDALPERIQIGKALYGLLYHPPVQSGVLQFAAQHKHTGSRADYWPHLFTSHRPNRTTGTDRLQERLQPAMASRYYSPKLDAAWSDQVLLEPERYDWFTSTDAFRYVGTPVAPAYNEMSEEYRFSLQKIKAAAKLT